MINWIQKKRNKKGFTLIELIVVIAILGILAAIAIPRLTGFQNKAKIRADIASARTIAGAVEMARADGKTDAEVTGKLLVPDYIQTWPEVQAVLTGMDSTGFVIKLGAGTEADPAVQIEANGLKIYPTPNDLYKAD